jgi:hypothetical protein
VTPAAIAGETLSVFGRPRLAPLNATFAAKRDRRRIFPLFRWSGLAVVDLARSDTDDVLG